MPKDLQDHICDDALFSKAFRTHADHLYKFLFYKFGSQLNPKDKVQEAFIKLWENCKKVPPSKAKSYLFTVANNLMLNEVAHQKIVLKHQQTQQKSQTNESPEFLMQEKEYQEKLEKAINNLSEAQRVAFLMNRVEGKKFKEIAFILDISVKAVEKRIYGALEKLRKDIKEI
ncbi:RNA polymerase sigma factor [Mangrovimonas futianensis]|uniref:RNA polymerase sigma factor n=1 Tax=Mangrovimonas futianensis TaxID=2895523 RepID=UPI001E5D15BE|nr:sigma-70 family RNA polymerase sigma factor [Mangrovimonas futianensis]MCF1422484.1 sigma-70 family RNA polymerase sigma factor [Mangrovimonas futianensis]